VGLRGRPIEHGGAEQPVDLVQPDRPLPSRTEESRRMSFVTVFTVGAMAFVLFVPVLMVLALSTASPLRRAAASGPVDSAELSGLEPAVALSRAA
jgi:hypothetical protein